jgi:phosphoserine phosphatase RsbU/P
MAIGEQFLRGQLESRREKLTGALTSPVSDPHLRALLGEVDQAIARMDAGTYGLCEVCNDTVEADRLLADPLMTFCLDHLTAHQQRALEADLQLAANIQRALLPSNPLHHGGWHVNYHYRPAGLVSGDYVDLIPPVNGAGDLVFLLGDVSGKGVAASMLMAHLHAMFRSLVGVGLPLDQLLDVANRLFCESLLSGQYATLMCGIATPSGDVRFVNAGHPAPLLVRSGQVTPFPATSVPLGMFCTARFTLQEMTLAPGDTLTLYTDGLSEASDSVGAEYGPGRLSHHLASHHALPPKPLPRPASPTWMPSPPTSPAPTTSP